MDNLLSHISIEKFAAFLEGNLPQDEMLQYSNLIAENDSLHQIMDSNGIIDGALSNYTDMDLQLPQEIEDFSFELPPIADSSFQTNPFTLNEMSNEHFAAAYDDEPIMMESDTNVDDDMGVTSNGDFDMTSSMETDLADNNIDTTLTDDL